MIRTYYPIPNGGGLKGTHLAPPTPAKAHPNPAQAKGGLLPGALHQPPAGDKKDPCHPPIGPGLAQKRAGQLYIAQNLQGGSS